MLAGLLQCSLGCVSASTTLNCKTCIAWQAHASQREHSAKLEQWSCNLLPGVMAYGPLLGLQSLKATKPFFLRQRGSWYLWARWGRSDRCCHLCQMRPLRPSASDTPVGPVPPSWPFSPVGPVVPSLPEAPVAPLSPMACTCASKLHLVSKNSLLCAGLSCCPSPPCACSSWWLLPSIIACSAQWTSF